MMTDISELVVHRGSTRLWLRTSFDEPLTAYSITKRGFELNQPLPQPRMVSRGIDKEKKRVLLAKLEPLLQPSHRTFWQELKEMD
jgi:hypothetical protein